MPNQKNDSLDLRIKEFSDRYAELKKRKELRGKPIVVNAGLLKAGKSSLFNALVGRPLFASDVVRATVENQKEELEKYILLDTPGLDACEKDTSVALDGYTSADTILYVHNLQEGELNQVEIDSINEICDLFGDREMFFKNVILVLTHKDQVEERYEQICGQIEAQSLCILGDQFAHVFCVDSVGYLKGLTENKPLLIKDSGIPELQRHIDSCISDSYDLQTPRFEKDKAALRSEIAQLKTELASQMPKATAVDPQKFVQAKREMETIITSTKKEVSEMTLPKQRQTSSDYRSYGKAKDYKDYSSESSATSAAKSEIENMISKVASAAKSDARYAVEALENCISPSGIPTAIRDRMMDSYEKIRKIAQKCEITLKQNFDITIPPSNDIPRKFSVVRDRARYIDTGNFGSASGYINRHSANLFIDWDYRHESVSGLFGTRSKEVKKYNFDAGGARDDVADDAAELVNEIASEARSAISPVFQEMKDTLLNQFEKMTDAILAQIDQEAKNTKRREADVRGKEEDIRTKINQLEKLVQDIALL